MNGPSGNLNGRRTTVTINHGVIAAGASQATTVACSGLAVGDRVVTNPNAAPEAGILIGAPRVSTTDVLEVSVANVTTATVDAGSAVVYNVQIFKATGSV